MTLHIFCMRHILCGDWWMTYSLSRFWFNFWLLFETKLFAYQDLQLGLRSYNVFNHASNVGMSCIWNIFFLASLILVKISFLGYAYFIYLRCFLPSVKQMHSSSMATATDLDRNNIWSCLLHNKFKIFIRNAIFPESLSIMNSRLLRNARLYKFSIAWPKSLKVLFSFFFSSVFII